MVPDRLTAMMRRGGGAAWKTGCFRGAPWWVRLLMAANFRSLPGAWAVAGLMGTPLWLWCRRQVLWNACRLCYRSQLMLQLLVLKSRVDLTKSCDMSCRFLRGSLLASPVVGAFVVSGRLAAAAVEVWVLWQYLGNMLRADADALEANRHRHSPASAASSSVS